MNRKATSQRFKCIDCAASTARLNEYYMVDDAVWQRAGDPHGMLCIGCLEHRINRKLNRDDFSDAPINSVSFDRKSRRLLNRMHRWN
jgi:hypothetical protein